MGILGKDMFDMDRMYTNTRVEFGAAGYWVEEKVYPLPYGFVLTEILNMDVTPFQEALDELESVISQSHTEAVLGTFFNALKWFGRLPLYRSYLYLAQDIEMVSVEELFTGEIREEIEEFVLQRRSKLIPFMQEQVKAIRFVQERYAWFLDELFSKAVFEKKKGQRKLLLAEHILQAHLEPFISGVSLGADREVDAPQVKTQYMLKGMYCTEPEIVERMYFDGLLDFVYVEFMKGLQRGFVPKRCAHCGRWFLQKPGMSYTYCDRPSEQLGGKTCRDVGAMTSFKEKSKNDPLWQIQIRAYKKYFARVRKGTMSKADFEVWSRQSEQLRDAAVERYRSARTDAEKNEIVDALRVKLNEV